ncbi:MAG: hypothetical protein HY359_13085 [Candidatus Rokubacteria bacterium]|nr:hypothetical protein [Candidatus Rokubacteria bacterium]
MLGLIAVGLLVGPLVVGTPAAAAPPAGDLPAADAARLGALMSGSPPADRGVAFTLRLVPRTDGGRGEEQVAAAESTGGHLVLTFERPARLKGHAALVRYNLVRYRPATGPMQTVSGLVRHFDYLPLVQFAALLLVDPSTTHVAARLPDVVVEGQARQVVRLDERADAHVFEQFEVQADPASGLPLVARATSVEDGREWRLRYRFDNRVETASGPAPFLSAIEVQAAAGQSWLLTLERPFLIDRAKVQRDLR